MKLQSLIKHSYACYETLGVKSLLMLLPVAVLKCLEFALLGEGVKMVL